MDKAIRILVDRKSGGWIKPEEEDKPVRMGELRESAIFGSQVEQRAVMVALGLPEGDHKHFRKAGLLSELLGGYSKRTMMAEVIEVNNLICLINQRDKSLKKLPLHIREHLEKLEEVPLLPLH